MKPASQGLTAGTAQGKSSYLIAFECRAGMPHSDPGRWASMEMNPRSWIDPAGNYAFVRGQWASMEVNLLPAVAAPAPPGLQDQLTAAVRGLLPSRELLGDMGQRVKRIETMVAAILQHVAVAQGSCWVPVESFEPEPYDVVIPFSAVVTRTGDEFQATFFDANLHACGSTPEEAVLNLKGVVLDSLDRFMELGDDRLGPEPLRQKAILSRHVRAR